MTTIDVDGESAADGLLTLVLAVVEILVDALEREAIRRMESGRLTDDEVDRLGQQLAAIETQIEEIEADHDLGDDVANLRGDLDDLVRDAIERLGETDGDDRSVADQFLAGDRP
ncbi:gas vesicle protein K [Halovivax asiaticus JCM 14624]|uniref:Gas vesicle protein K n=1 Tax=Halovivax asiaticus JCM 14624 TaxID=1227490 RepID=M0BG71_9EURY|nr:gas vesicle protein K [Halovivax asiaticus]ELZ08639.1 gas vesicle protein K [Halovivax asiaticus JCM 14624]